jgi:hypothetical protein
MLLIIHSITSVEIDEKKKKTPKMGISLNRFLCCFVFRKKKERGTHKKKPKTHTKKKKRKIRNKQTTRICMPTKRCLCRKQMDKK